jgi:hypothetical protein
VAPGPTSPRSALTAARLEVENGSQSCHPGSLVCLRHAVCSRLQSRSHPASASLLTVYGVRGASPARKCALINSTDTESHCPRGRYLAAENHGFRTRSERLLEHSSVGAFSSPIYACWLCGILLCILPQESLPPCFAYSKAGMTLAAFMELGGAPSEVSRAIVVVGLSLCVES